MPKIYQRGAARRDLVEHFVYLAENANLETAERFLAQTEASFNVLAEQPLIGAPLQLHNPALAGMRKWRVKDFDNHLIFYLPHHRSCVYCMRHVTGGACWKSKHSRVVERYIKSVSAMH